MALTSQEVSQLLSRPLLARIATVDLATLQPYVVPVWYLWDGTELWISELRHARKFSTPIQNSKCAIVIDDAESSTSVKGVLLEGETILMLEPRELVEEIRLKIYRRYLKEEELRKTEVWSWIYHPENVVYRMKPAEIYTW